VPFGAFGDYRYMTRIIRDYLVAGSHVAQGRSLVRKPDLCGVRCYGSQVCGCERNGGAEARRVIGKSTEMEKLKWQI
jgi:hypothetical protein